MIANVSIVVTDISKCNCGTENFNKYDQVSFHEEFISFFPAVRAATPGAVGRPRSEIDLETGLLNLLTYKYEVYMKVLVTNASCI